MAEVDGSRCAANSFADTLIILNKSSWEPAESHNLSFGYLDDRIGENSDQEMFLPENPFSRGLVQ